MKDNIFSRIEIEIQKAQYAYKRYSSPSSFALLYHEKKLSPEQLSIFVRLSDKFLDIGDNVYFITFSYTSSDDVFKAAQNLLQELDKFFNNRTSCIAIDTFNAGNSPRMVLQRLSQILNETKKRSYTRIEDESILDTI